MQPPSITAALSGSQLPVRMVDVPQPPPDVVPLPPSPHPVPPPPEMPPEVQEPPDLPGRGAPVRDPIVPTGVEGPLQ